MWPPKKWRGSLHSSPHFWLPTGALSGLHPTGNRRRADVVHRIRRLGKKQVESRYRRRDGWCRAQKHALSSHNIYEREKRHTGKELKRNQRAEHNYWRPAKKKKKKKAVWGTYGNFPSTICSWMGMGEILRGFRMQGLETKTTFKIAAAGYFYLSNSIHIFQPMGRLAGWNIQGCRKNFSNSQYRGSVRVYVDNHLRDFPHQREK